MPSVGACSPQGIVVTITPESSGDDVDFTTVTGPVLLSVRRPSETVTWSFTITAATERSLSLQHIFAADGSDATEEANYFISGWLYVGPDRYRELKDFSVPFTT